MSDLPGRKFFGIVESPATTKQGHVIVLTDDEKAELVEILATTDDHFANLRKNGVIVAEVPQTEAIKAYRGIIQSILGKAQRS